MKKVAFIYPGQGSQHVGMGEAFVQAYPTAQKLFEQADQLLDFDITELMFEGPSEKLTQTENAQPALLLTSTVITRLLQDNGITPDMVAGHSLGEYSALVAARALSFEDALSLVRIRGQLMEQAYPKGKGAMAAVLGLDQKRLQAELQKIANQTNQVVEMANLNCPGQIVISGDKGALEQAEIVLKEAGAKRVLPLSVSGPFHSSLMKPAAESFTQTLDTVRFSDATIPMYANVTADIVKNKDEIKSLLIEQLYSTVRFEEIIQHMAEKNLDAIVEIGSGKVLTGLVKKINRKMKTFTIQDPDSLSDFVTWYKEGE